MDNLIYKTCTECGQTKHISEFSKSYPKRCKVCVAEHTREARAKEKENRYYETENGRKLLVYTLEFEKGIDWEQRRYEIAKELMKGFAANSHNQCVDASSEMLAQWSVGGADVLIEKLKKPKDNEPPTNKQSPKIEIHVGGEYLQNGKYYICEEKTENEDCSGCAFLENDDCLLQSGIYCYKEYRQDKKNVIFKKKGGEQ